MSAAISMLHFAAGLIVLAEALNKLERTCVRSPRATRRDRGLEFLKALSWSLLALGAGGALAVPLLSTLGVPAGGPHTVMNQPPSLAETCVLTGFAVLAIRTRLKDEYDRKNPN